MLYSAALFAGLVALAAAQNTTSTNGTSATGYSTNNTQSYPYYLDASAIAALPQADKDQACLAQRNTCNQLCVGAANPNSCDNESLDWACTCTNMATPNITAYAQTVPAYECTQYINNTVASTNNPTLQAQLRAVKCGPLIAVNSQLPAGGTYVPSGVSYTGGAVVVTASTTVRTTAPIIATAVGASSGTAAVVATVTATRATASAAAASASATARSDGNAMNAGAAGAIGAGLLAFLAV